jgi:hypothetical protein
LEFANIDILARLGPSRFNDVQCASGMTAGVAVADIAFPRELGRKDLGVEYVCFAKAFCRNYDSVCLKAHGQKKGGVFMMEAVFYD